MSDTQRIAAVTGGSRGIGRAIVEALAERGWRVFFCSKNQESVDEATSQLTEKFGEGKIAGRAVDVREESQVDDFVSWARSEGGRLDCLVANAGLGYFGPVDELTGDQWREVLRTNLDGAFYLIRAAAPAMREQGGGYIFNIASLASVNPFAGGAAYNASKFGLLGMSDAAMLDLRQDGIRVTAILPGSVDTGFGDREGRDTSWMLDPDDVARTVVDLLAYPERALPSRVELRPTKPKK